MKILKVEVFQDNQWVFIKPIEVKKGMIFRLYDETENLIAGNYYLAIRDTVMIGGIPTFTYTGTAKFD